MVAWLYILDDHDEAVPCYDLLAWNDWMAAASRSRRRVVAADRDEGDPGQQVYVSTVFLGVDHSFGGKAPVLWETMAFLNENAMDHCSRRYTSKEAALAGHQEVCRLVLAAIRQGAKALPHG